MRAGNGEYRTSCSEDVSFPNLTDGNLVMTIANVSNFAINPDGSRLAVVRSDGMAELWDTKRRNKIATLARYPYSGLVIFSPNGKLLATASKLSMWQRFDNPIRLFDSASGRPGGLLRGHKSGIRRMEFSPDSTTLAVGRTTTNPCDSGTWQPARPRRPLPPASC